MEKPKKKRGGPSGTALETQQNKVKFFFKNIIEGKNVSRCAREMGLSRRTMHNYKNDDDYRLMALEHLENSKLKGLTGTVGKLVGALDAVKPIVTQDPDGSTHITHVPDQKTRMEALKEVIKIYGIHAPQRKDTTVSVTFSSDAELFRQIDEAERACRYVESYEKGQTSDGVVTEQPVLSGGNFKSRQRAILQVDSIPEP